MRLPNLDISLLAIHALFSAASGDASHDRKMAARPDRATRSRPATPSGPTSMAAARPAALSEAMTRATHAGLFDHREARRRGDRHAPRQDDAQRAPRRARAADGPSATVTPTPPMSAAMPGARNASLASAPWTDIWDTLPIYQRVDLVRAMARAQRLEMPLPESIDTVEQGNVALTWRWLSHPIDRPVRRVYPGLPAYLQEGQRTDDVDVDRMLRSDSTRRLADMVSTAGELAQHVHPWPLTAEKEAAYQADRLADLFDLERLCDPPRSDLALLRVVHATLGTQFPGHRAPMLDEHAVTIAARLRRRCEDRSGEGSPEDPQPARTFTREVTAELEAEAFAARLIPLRTTATAKNAPPWFDGMAIQNAIGKNIPALAADFIRLQPDLAYFMSQTKLACGTVLPVRPQTLLSIATPRCHRLLEIWMRKRLNDLLESTRFPLGTLAQSVDTILLRLAGIHGVRLSSEDDVAAVFRDFNRLCAAWRAAPAYWMSPTLAAALHFVHATGNEARLLAVPVEERENRVIDFFHAHLAAYAAPAKNGTDVTNGTTSRKRRRRMATALLIAKQRAEARSPSNDDVQDTAISIQSVVAREFLQSILVLPNWPLHVGETLARGDTREIVSMLPFVVPAYDIEEGIRHGNETRALRGAFQFGVDLLMTWLGGRVEASLASPASLSFTEHGERAMLGMLHRGLETLGDAQRVALPLTEQVVAEPPAARMTRAGSELPLRYRPLAARARAGEVVPIGLPNVPRAGLVHLPRENRLVPLGWSGDVIWELDWRGHIVAPVSDARLGELKQKVLAELRQPAALVEPTGASTEAIARGTTVTSTRRWLDTHAGEPLPGGAASEHYAETVLRELMAFDETNNEELRIYQELGTAHCRSATLRLLVNQAVRRPDGKPLRLRIRSGTIPGYLPTKHVITLPPSSELAEIEYRGATGSVHFDPRDVWIHEFVHALTLLTDPTPPLSTAHRGPVVYFTDRILYEINRRTPERIAYAAPVTRAHPSGTSDLRHAAERAVRENILLDAELARHTSIPPSTLVCGMPVSQRTTVVAAKRIEAIVRAPRSGRAPRAPFPSALVQRLHANNFLVSEHSSAHLRLLRHFVEHARFIYNGNTWARKFLDAWIERDTTTRWTLHRLPRVLAERDGVPCRVDSANHRIELSLASSFAYLSPTGLKPYTMQRRVASLLAEIGLPARTRAPDLDVDTERGAAVYVENKLLGLDGEDEQRRVCARIWSTPPVDPPVATPTVNPTFARRVADDEDRFLAATCAPQPDGTCICS